MLESAPRGANVDAEGDVSCVALAAEDFERVLGSLQVKLQERTLVRALRSVPLWSGLPDAPLKNVAAAFKTRKKKKGAVLQREGDASSRVCVVRSGQIQLRSRKGRDHAIREVAGPGQVFGAEALDDPPGAVLATATVVSERAEIYHCPRDEVFNAAGDGINKAEDANPFDRSSLVDGGPLECGRAAAGRRVSGPSCKAAPGRWILCVDDARALGAAETAGRGGRRHAFVAAFLGRVEPSGFLLEAPVLSGRDLWDLRVELPRGPCGGCDERAATYAETASNVISRESLRPSEPGLGSGILRPGFGSEILRGRRAKRAT